MIRAHLNYLWYVLRHKWFVLVACCRFGIPLRGLLHDLSKFRVSEWFPYVRHFYGGARAAQNRDAVAGSAYKPGDDEDFDRAKVLRMPRAVMLEMAADWIGAGKAQGRTFSTFQWMWRQKNMRLHPVTRALLETFLEGCE